MHTYSFDGLIALKTFITKPNREGWRQFNQTDQTGAVWQETKKGKQNRLISLLCVLDYPPAPPPILTPIMFRFK